MTETKKIMVQQTVIHHQHVYKNNVFHYHNHPTQNIDSSASMVNIDKTHGSVNQGKLQFKHEDLPDELREYEERVLKQLEEEEEK